MSFAGREGKRRARLDVILVERGLAGSRTDAHELISAGRVLVDGAPAVKPGRRVPGTADLTVEGPPRRYVSRGGIKLEKGLDVFGLDPSGRVCLDVGASTGGFTDCLLSRGAVRVYAVDVGYGLLAWKLRGDSRVVALDRTNARYLSRGSFAAAVEDQGTDVAWPSLVVCDVSFISLRKVIPPVMALLESPWDMVLLVKPQFETSRQKVGARGVVRCPEVHAEVLGDVLGAFRPNVSGLTFSPLRGPEGNIEYLLWLTEAPAGDDTAGVMARMVPQLVSEAFASSPGR